MRVVFGFYLFCAATAFAAPAFQSEHGELDGAKYSWIHPIDWNHRVLILAPPMRKDTAPSEPALAPNDPKFQPLLSEGWMIAITNYRRTGLILADATEDIDALRAAITKRYGSPDRVLIEGELMGGRIALLLAERDPGDLLPYQGVVAIDPTFELREGTDERTAITFMPKIPVIFLSTRQEFSAAERYASVNIPGALRPFTPGLLRINRGGRGNVNAAEKLLALRTLNQWLDDGGNKLPRADPEKAFLDATITADAKSSRVFMDPDQRGFVAHVADISAADGNLLLDAQGSDFAEIGISANLFFRTTIRGHTFRVRFDKDASTVKKGEWVAFPDAEGDFWISRHQLSAAHFTQSAVGDLVHVETYRPDAPPLSEE